MLYVYMYKSFFYNIHINKINNNKHIYIYFINFLFKK